MKILYRWKGSKISFLFLFFSFPISLKNFLRSLKNSLSTLYSLFDSFWPLNSFQGSPQKKFEHNKPWNMEVIFEKDGKKSSKLLYKRKKNDSQFDRFE